MHGQLLRKMFAFTLIGLVWSPTAMGQGNDADTLFGNGVHAFHSGAYSSALAEFNRALKLGSRDPRVLYYRGAALSAMGESEAAQASMQAGARIESFATGRFYSVDSGLERLQGNVRLQIESARNAARRAAERRFLDAAGQPMMASIDALPYIPSPDATPVDPRSLNYPDTAGREYRNVPFVANPDRQPVESETRMEDDPFPVDRNDGSIPVQDIDESGDSGETR